MARKKQSARAIMSEEESGLRLLDNWLRIENEHTDAGFTLPSRATVVGWIETHAVASLLLAGGAVFAPVIGALTFG